MTALTLVLFFLLCGSPALPQTPTGDPPPLVVADQGRGVNRLGQEVVNFSLTNRSPKAISAYALVIAFSGSSGKTALTQVVRAAVGGVLPTARPDYAPGEIWTDHGPGAPRNANGSRLVYSLEVDYVHFADGTSWGKDKSRSAPFFEGLKEGARMMRGALRRKLEREGPAAVQDFLLRP